MRPQKHFPVLRSSYLYVGAGLHLCRLCKNETVTPQCPLQAEFFGGFGGTFCTKITIPQGGQRPPQAENFGTLGTFYTKITLLECIQERASGAKHLPKCSKNFALIP